MGKGIWDRVYGKGRHEKIAAAEKSALDPNTPKRKPKPKPKKKSLEKSISDDFWSS